MKALLLIIQFSLFISLSFAQDNCRLVINPKGHTSNISGVVLSPDEKLMISVSFDKSIKIWSTEYGNLVDEIFGERGEGNDGQLYCVAISPDGKQMAVGGYLIEKVENEAKAYGLIRIYDFQTRKLIKVLKGHANVVNSLAYSPNGKQLASAGSDGHVILWNTNDHSIYNDFASHANAARTVCFMGDGKLVSGGWDGKVLRYDIANKKIDKTLENEKKIINEICYNEVSKKLVVVYQENAIVQLMSSDLVVKQEIDASKPVSTISTKGDKLIIGQERAPYMTSMYQWNGKEFVITNGFAGMNNTVMGSGLLKNGLAFCAGGRDNEIVFWHYEEADKDGMVNFAQDGEHFRGYGMALCAVGYSNNMIAFTQGECDYAYGTGTLESVMDLNTGGLYKLPVEYEKPFRGVRMTKDDYKLKHEQGGSLNYLNGCLSLFEKDSRIWKFTMDESSGFCTSAYTFASQNLIAAGAGNDIYLITQEGNQVARLEGHEGEVEAIWSDSTGEHLISAGRDQTIRIWNANDLNTNKSYMKYEELYPAAITWFKNLYPDLDFSNPAGMEKLYNKLLVDFGDDTARFLVTLTVIEPEANIFVGWNNEWIIWTKDGYFKASKEGSKYIGYHINNGQERDANYYPFDQFDLKYNRPDIINERLGIGDSIFNLSLKAAHDRRLKSMGLKESDLTGKKNLPEIEIISSAANTAEPIYKLEISANDKEGELYKVMIYNNDVPVLGTAGYLIEAKDKKSLKKTFDIPLIRGSNTIKVSVFNKEGAESLRETVTILCSHESNKGNLYLVTIGVSDYATNSFNLKYAAKDAVDVEKLFADSKIHGQIFTKSYTNDKVNKTMLTEIKEFLSKSEVNDQVIIFIAGHGVLNANFQYYYAPHDMDFMKPEANGISYAAIESMLDGIKPLKKTLFMDTCHSGEIDQDDVVADNKVVVKTGKIGFRDAGNAVTHKSLDMKQTTELMKEVFTDMRKGTGSNIISAASGYGLAGESQEWDNGLFTHVLIEGLKTMEADLNADGMIMMSELKTYSGAKVAELSKGDQVPTNRNENIGFDYRVW